MIIDNAEWEKCTINELIYTSNDLPQESEIQNVMFRVRWGAGRRWTWRRWSSRCTHSARSGRTCQSPSPRTSSRRSQPPPHPSPALALSRICKRDIQGYFICRLPVTVLTWVPWGWVWPPGPGSCWRWRPAWWLGSSAEGAGPGGRGRSGSCGHSGRSRAGHPPQAWSSALCLIWVLKMEKSLGLDHQGGFEFYGWGQTLLLVNQLLMLMLWQFLEIML